MMVRTLTPDELERHIDVLDRAEPQQAGWRGAFDALYTALNRGRRVRQLWTIPAAVAAAILTIVLHQDRWGTNDLRNLFLFYGLIMIAIFYVMGKLYPVLAREGRVAALLRYYGVRDIPEEESPFL